MESVNPPVVRPVIVAKEIPWLEELTGFIQTHAYDTDKK